MAVVLCLAFCVPWSVCSDLFSRVAVSEETQHQCSQCFEILIPHPHRLRGASAEMFLGIIFSAFVLDSR